MASALKTPVLSKPLSKSRILIGQFLPCLRLASKTFAEWASLQQLPSRRLHIGAFAFEIIVDRPPEAGIGDVVRRIGGAGQVAACELVLALGAGLDAGGESVAALAPDGLALARRQRGEEIVEGREAAVCPMELLVGAQQEATLAERTPFRLGHEGDVGRGGIA